MCDVEGQVLLDVGYLLKAHLLRGEGRTLEVCVAHVRISLIYLLRVLHSQVTPLHRVPMRALARRAHYCQGLLLFSVPRRVKHSLYRQCRQNSACYKPSGDQNDRPLADIRPFPRPCPLSRFLIGRERGERSDWFLLG